MRSETHINYRYTTQKLKKKIKLKFSDNRFFFTIANTEKQIIKNFLSSRKIVMLQTSAKHLHM